MISLMLRNTFQIEFIQTPYFQILLKELVQNFVSIAKKPQRTYKVISMCIHALQDITPQLIDRSLENGSDTHLLKQESGIPNIHPTHMKMKARA